MKCIICGKNSESEYCFQHKRRKPLAVQATTHAANRPKRTLRSHKSKGESSPNEDHLFFKKISDNEFTICGTIDIMERKIKSVEVDVETYTKTEIIDKTIDVSEL